MGVEINSNRADMGDEVKNQIGAGQPVPVADELVCTNEDANEASSLSKTDNAATNIVGAIPSTAAVASGALAFEYQERGSAGNNEQCHTAKRQKDIELGAVAAVFSFAVMLAGFFLSPTAVKGPDNWRLDIVMLLAFASFICGFSFMLLSMQLLGAPEIQISICHLVISRCLYCVCIVLPALTLLGLLVVMPFKPYAYIGLAVLAVVALPVVLAHWYVSHRTAGEAPETDAALEAELKAQTEELEASSKITEVMAASSFAGLVGTLFGVYKQHSGSAGATPCSVHVAVMFMFSTAVVSMLLMMLSMKALEVKNRDLLRSAVWVIRHANNVLLCSLGIAALSAAFVILRCYILAAFVPLAVAATVHFIIRHCTAARRREQGEPNRNLETRLRWMANIASKVTAYSLGGVMAIFGGFLGDSDNSSADKTVAIKICMFLLTSALASGLGLMWLTTRPGGSGGRVGSNAATNILAWSAMGLLAVATLAIYGAEVMKS